MRILGLTNLYPSPWFPLRGVFNRQQFGALAAQSEVRLIVPVSWTDEIRTRPGAMPSLEGRRSSVDGIQVDYPRYIFPPKVLRGRYGHSMRWSTKRAFQTAVEEFCPDIVLSAWAYPDGWAAVELGHQAGLPVVVKLHGSDVLILSKIPACRPRLAEVLTGADGIITVSRDLAQKAAALGAPSEQVRTIYDGVDTGRFYPGDRTAALSRLGLAGTSPLLLFIGNLLPVKGVDLLVHACHELRLRGVEFRCFLIGQGPLRAKLEEMIGRLHLGDCIKLVGPMSHAHLPDWYRAADVFVLPSRSEGVPCVLLEAAACRTPFVATTVGGIPEAAEWGDSLLVAPEDPTALAGAIADKLRASGAHHISPFNRTHAAAATEINEFLDSVRAGFKAARSSAGNPWNSVAGLRSACPVSEGGKQAP